MARETNYINQIEKEKQEKKKKELCFENIKNKIGKENLSSDELKTIIMHYKGLDSLTTRTVTGYINQLCKMSDGLLNEEDFKFDGEYCFKSKYHGLLIALLCTDYFGGKKRKNKLSDRALLYQQLVDNIKNHLNDVDKDLIVQNPAYYNARIESKFTKHINTELYAISNIMYNCDPIIRYQLMVEVLDKLVSLRRWMQDWDLKIRENRLLYADNVEEYREGIIQKGSFKHITLEHLMIRMLAAKIKSQKYEYISKNEELSYPATYITTKTFDIYGSKENEIQKYLDSVDLAIENTPKYIELMNKAKKILNLENPIEKKVYEQLDSLCKVRFAAPYVHPNDYERMVRFVENCIGNDKREILKLLETMSENAFILQETMDKIMNIKVRVEIKKEKGMVSYNRKDKKN